MESYDKKVVVNLSLVTWQYEEYSGVWKNFESNPSCAGDNVVLENAFQAGKKKITLSHGWYQTVRVKCLDFLIFFIFTFSFFLSFLSVGIIIIIVIVIVIDRHQSSSIIIDSSSSLIHH